MSRIANPYFAGPPATQPETFFGRQDVLRFVDETLASPMHNMIVFYGQRRIGKTSILYQIAHRSGQGYQAVFFDLQSSASSPAHDLLYTLAREVADQLKLATPARADFEHDLDTFRTRFLPKVYHYLGNRRLLLLLDEFDTLSLGATPAELDALPFVKALNRMIQSDDKQVVFLFVVGRRLKDLSEQQLQIFRGGRDRQIGLLKKEDAMQLITRPAEGILTYQDAAVERIWTLTSGHPYFTQLLCQEIFNQAQRQNVWTVTESHVEAVIDDAINTGQSALQWFWDEVLPIERFMLYTIGQLETEKKGVTLDQLIDWRDAQRAQIDELELRALPDQLVDRQVLKRDSAQRYHFAVELVRHWIVGSHSLEEVTTELTRAAIDELAKALFETGRAAYRANDTNLAIENFSRALSVNSHYVEARLWLARAHTKVGDLLAAINEFVNVERFGGPQQREARLGLADARAQYGQQLEQEGNIEQAKQEYQRVLELDPQHALANARLSEVFRRQADEYLVSEGVAAAQSFYELALQHSVDADLKRQIVECLDQYSYAQKAIHNWGEAERARHLSAMLMSGAGDDPKTLLRFQVERGRWHLGKHELEAAANVYRRTLEETTDDATRQIIENDILRYSKQQEEDNLWNRAEIALTLLVQLFPDDPEHRGRLIDHLCRQGEFYLDQDDFAMASAAYRRALNYNPSDQTLRGLIRAGFQSYRRARAEDKTVPTRKLVEEAMLILVEILGQEDTMARQWLFEAWTDLGDALRAEGKLAEAQAVYRQALEDAIHMLQLAAETDQAYRFDEAAKRVGQALAGAAPGQEMVDRIKTIFNNYRHRQEEKLRWSHARRAMEELACLFPEDENTRFWLAETQASEAGWHLQRAIPDLDEAQRLAHSALDVPLSHPKAELIITQIIESFRTHSRRREEGAPPNWIQAEQVMNRLVSLLPNDAAVNHWLADTRLRQGDWYLAQESQSPVEARRYLTEAAAVYKRALKDLPDDDSLKTHLKRSFKAYCDRQEQSDPLAQSLAEQAMQLLAELLPRDEGVQQWLAETKKKAIPAPLLGWRWQRRPIIAVVTALLLCLGIGVVFGARERINNLTSLFFPATAAPLPDLPEGEGLDVVTNPSNDLEVLVILKGTGIFKSDNSGGDWRMVSNERTVETLHIAPAKAEIVYAGAFAQVLKSEDQGETWRASSIPPNAQIYAIATDPDDANVVFVATDRGIMRSSDGGQTWITLDRAGPNGEQLLDSRFYSIVAAKTPQGNRVYAAGDGDQIYWRGADDTDSPWQTQVCTVCARTIFALAIDPRDSNKLLGGSDEGGLAISRNAGYDWARATISPSIPTLKFSILAFDPINPQIVYAGSGNYRNPTDGEGLYRSLDGGLTWQRFNAWAPSGDGRGTYVQGIALTPTDSQVIWIAGSEGVFRSDDGGISWTRQ